MAIQPLFTNHKQTSSKLLSKSCWGFLPWH